jgi:hypothetical protein
VGLDVDLDVDLDVGLDVDLDVSLRRDEFRNPCAYYGQTPILLAASYHQHLLKMKVAM